MAFLTVPTAGTVSTGSQCCESNALASQDEGKKKGGRRRTKPQLLIKPAATGRQMAGCTCASLTQLRLSCPFDDSLPGVASWASTGGEARRAVPLLLCITGGTAPRENTTALAAQALVAASQPACWGCVPCHALVKAGVGAAEKENLPPRSLKAVGMERDEEDPR